MDKQCKRCGTALKGKQLSYCSELCSRRHLKSLWQKRKRDVVNAQKRKWRKLHPDLIKAQNLRYKLKKGFTPKPPRIKKEKIKKVYYIHCELCPDRIFISQRIRKFCPIHGRLKNKKLRFKILERDGFRCTYCGRKAPEVVLHVDHVHPIAKGGTNEEINLVTACWDCNIGKSDNLLNVK